MLPIIDPVELVSELLRNAAAICVTHGVTLEKFVECAALAYAADQGEVLDEFKFDAVLSERPASN